MEDANSLQIAIIWDHMEGWATKVAQTGIS